MPTYGIALISQSISSSTQPGLMLPPPNPVNYACFYILKIFLKKLNFILFFYLLQINYYFMFLYYFNMFMLKIFIKK